jgi:transposase
MDATTLTVDSPLPDDVPTLQDLVRQLLAEVTRLRERLDAALQRRYGRRSERRPPVLPKDQSQPRKSTPHGRAELPAHLERRDVVHDLTPDEQRCPCCGQPRRCIGEQTSEQLDLDPAHFFVRRTIKKTYACAHCDPALVPAEQRLQTAGPAQVGPIAKGLCGPGLLAHDLTAKFADHVPLHRLAGQLARSGVRIADSTLGDWLAGAADLLEPLCRLMRQRLLLSRVIHSDDTTVKLRVPGADRTSKAHLWTYLGDAAYPYVVFDFTADYTGAGPARFLEGYKGYLQADALAQYEELYGAEKIKHCCCWAHARRKFVAAAERDPAGAQPALEWIGQLYAIERELPPLLPPGDELQTEPQRRQREEQRRNLRQTQAQPILEALHAWLDQHKNTVLPKSLLGVALGYARNNWVALQRYLEQGYLAIDNNLSERTLRAIALGRNNWGVLGSEAGGRIAALAYTVVGTCKHLQIDPFAYLREALMGLFELGEKPTAEQLTEWLPDRWLLRQSNGAKPVAAAG